MLLVSSSCVSVRIYCTVVATVPPPPVNPCDPSPCGPNSQCRVIGSQPACSCLPNYLGRPPNCRPECTISTECANNLACQNEKCVDPCPGSCGDNAKCTVVNHNSVCSCLPGYIGDPFVSCSLAPPRKETLSSLFVALTKPPPALCFCTGFFCNLCHV